MVWLGAENEAYPPAQEASASQSPRLPCTHVNGRRRQGYQGPPPQGPPPPDTNLQPAGAVTHHLGRVKRRARLLASADFDRTLRSGRRAASDYLALLVSDNDVGRPRVGLAVSRKLGNAVIRNRIKRRLRELVKPLLTQTGGGRDVVIVARARAVDAEFTRLRQEIEMLWAKGWGR